MLRGDRQQVGGLPAAVFQQAPPGAGSQGEQNTGWSGLRPVDRCGRFTDDDGCADCQVGDGAASGLGGHQGEAEQAWAAGSEGIDGCALAEHGG